MRKGRCKGHVGRSRQCKSRQKAGRRWWCIEFTDRVAKRQKGIGKVGGRKVCVWCHVCAWHVRHAQAGSRWQVVCSKAGRRGQQRRQEEGKEQGKVQGMAKAGRLAGTCMPKEPSKSPNLPNLSKPSMPSQKVEMQKR